jgi:hypothetical protein
MASGNPTWGEERIADELLLKIGIRISPQHRSSLYAQATSAASGSNTTLDEICAQSCEGDHRV